MDYKETAQSGNSYSHMWDVETTREFEGGFLFDKTTVPSGTLKLPKGVFLKVDHTERKATLVKTAVLAAAITAESTEVRIEKGSMLLATDVIGIGSAAVTVGAIDSSEEDYDSFDIVAQSLGTAASGAILQTYDSAGATGKVAVNPDGLNYREIDLDAQPSCSVIYEARGIVVSRLPQAITTAIKTALKFMQFIG
jgi:hypothetical protein